MPDLTKREVVRTVLEGGCPPYVPWSMGFTCEAKEKLQTHYGCDDIEKPLENHILKLGSDIGFFEDRGDHRVQDVFGVVWDRTVDRDIGNVEGLVLPEPTLAGYEFPDPLDPRFFENIPARIEEYPDRFRVFQLGFSLYERAWTLRGIENLLLDFVLHPEFVTELFNAIGEYNRTQVREAMKYDIDAVYFGDDWGQQKGLQMGGELWRRFILPVLEKMYGLVRQSDKFVMIHSCGDVHELFDDLVDIGLNCFNPFQPEVMDIFEIFPRYKGRLAFHGGLSTQRTLPFGTPDDVRKETKRLLELGAEGGYIMAPAHDMEGDVPLENMLAAIETVQSQAGFVG